MSEKELIIPKHGGFRKLKSFQIAQLVYDLTVRFTTRYIESRSRTRDQMVQAARSGVQNIAEGSQASGTSKKSEMKLTNVARASLEELRLDYEDYLRQRRLPIWERSDPRRQNLIDSRPVNLDDVVQWTKKVHSGAVSTSSTKSTSSTATYAEIAANGALALISVACVLLDRQIATQARDFENDGGFTERLYRVRKTSRNP